MVQLIFILSSTSYLSIMRLLLVFASLFVICAAQLDLFKGLLGTFPSISELFISLQDQVFLLQERIILWVTLWVVRNYEYVAKNFIDQEFWIPIRKREEIDIDRDIRTKMIMMNLIEIYWDESETVSGVNSQLKWRRLAGNRDRTDAFGNRYRSDRYDREEEYGD